MTRRRPYTVTLEISWAGTLHDYRSIPGAIRIVGLADDAVAFDAGRQIALRSGELVAVVTDSRSAGGSPNFTEASAREVADADPKSRDLVRPWNARFSLPTGIPR